MDDTVFCFSARPDGVTPAHLRSGRYRRLFRGVYVAATVPVTLPLRARAALCLGGEDACVSHHTAAQLWGGVVPEEPRVHVTDPQARTRVSGIVSHRARVMPLTTVHRTVRLTTPAQTWCDLTGVLTLVDLVVLGDSLVRRGRCSVAELVAAAARMRGAGSRTARAAAALVRSEVDSPQESRLRLLLTLAGLPEPVVNHAIRMLDGQIRFRLDLSYPGYRLAIEYDGRQHAESASQWQWDLSRREWLDQHGWRLIVVTAQDLRDPAALLARVSVAMADVGMPAHRLDEKWRLHFASRAA